eukprot:7089842-Prymnesium_polylepis.2
MLAVRLLQGCGGPRTAPAPSSSEDNNDDDSSDNSDESHDCGGYNLLGQITHSALALWPVSVPVVFLGFRAGEGVFTGMENAERDLDDSPCDVAYRIFCEDLEAYCNEGEGRNSWDPMAVLFAVRGDTHGYYREAKGTIQVETPSG